MEDTNNTNNTTKTNSEGSGAVLDTKLEQPEITVELVQRTSKAGNKYIALETRVGEYSTLAFPTKVEQLYIDNILNSCFF